MGNSQPVPAEPMLDSIQIGLPQTVSWAGFNESTQQPKPRNWETAFLKTPVTECIWAGATKLAGDGQADIQHHGGPDKAICVYSLDHYAFWRDELNLPGFQNGSFGENFTVAGLSESDACIGDTWAVGEAIVQVSQPRQPCWKLARRWGLKDLAARVERNGRTGWYFRVLQEGLVAAAMPLRLIERIHPQWTVAAANRVMYQDKRNLAAAIELATIDELSSSWKVTLQARINKLKN